ncbi:hypothetical protein EJ377_02860 [Chryseobacterium arthrosphaerae]|uniref:Uncharacterized protein n=1 Tax=Chryseobacterium arthrosphaerae TaxID=651561 RepID=A0A432DZ64_9FLAO|nr:hypothetical protein EJ377_02860 [Chryseobacterium arthrosphaerae]
MEWDGIVDSGQGYIQQQRFDGTAHAYDLLLQPSGGNVVVGSNQMDYHNDKLETIGKIVSKGNEMNSVKPTSLFMVLTKSLQAILLTGTILPGKWVI